MQVIIVAEMNDIIQVVTASLQYIYYQKSAFIKYIFCISL